MNPEEPRTPATKGPAEQALDDHRETMAVVAEVESCMDRNPDRAWVADLATELPRLESTLRRHFAEEQEGPLYSRLPFQHPRLAARLGRLEAEHAVVLRSIRDAVERAGTLGEAPLYELRAFASQVQLLVATIRRHEAEENEIILEADWDEVGTGD